MKARREKLGGRRETVKGRRENLTTISSWTNHLFHHSAAVIAAADAACAAPAADAACAAAAADDDVHAMNVFGKYLPFKNHARFPGVSAISEHSR